MVTTAGEAVPGAKGGEYYFQGASPRDASPNS